MQQAEPPSYLWPPSQKRKSAPVTCYIGQYSLHYAMLATQVISHTLTRAQRLLVPSNWCRWSGHPSRRERMGFIGGGSPFISFQSFPLTTIAMIWSFNCNQLRQHRLPMNPTRSRINISGRSMPLVTTYLYLYDVIIFTKLAETIEKLTLIRILLTLTDYYFPPTE